MTARALPASGRRLGLSLVLAGLAGVVTGPSGNSDEPLAGVTGSLGGTRGAVFAALGVAGWLLCEFARRLRNGALGQFGQFGWFGQLGRLGQFDRFDRFGRFGRLSGTGPLAPPPAPPRRWSSWLAGPLVRRLLGPVVATGGLAVALVAPLVVSTAAQQSMVNDIGMYALLALGLNVVVGNAGLLDLGYIAFFAIGAYTTAYFTSATAMPWHAPFQLNPFFVLPLALAVAAVAGIVLGAPTLRLRGDYLAIVTLGFGEIVQLLANNADGVTNGSRGVFGVPPLSLDLPGVHYSFGIGPLPYYYLLLALIIIVMVVFGIWERSATGRSWTAVRDDEVAARACGVAAVRMKLLAFAIGASVSGFAGVVLATKQFFNPQSFGVMASFLVLTVVIFGGSGSRYGVVLGSVVLMGLAYLLRDLVPPSDRYLYFGAVVVIMMIFRPQGLLPARPRRTVPGRPDRPTLSAPTPTAAEPGAAR